MNEAETTATTWQQESAVSGYRIVAPDGWFAVDLEPGRMERSVAALVKRQFAGIDNAPLLKAQARQQLLAQTQAAQAAGGLEMFLSLQQVAGVPIAASLVIFLVPTPGQVVTAADLARSLDTGDERRVTVVELRTVPPRPPWRYSCRCPTMANGCCCRSLRRSARLHRR
jgi:hypothetical protein